MVYKKNGGTLASRLERCYQEKAKRLGDKLQECGISESISQAMQQDLRRAMLYTGERFVGTMEQAKEFAKHDGFPQVRDFGKEDAVNTALLIDDYLNLAAVAASLDSLEMLVKRGGAKTKDEKSLYAAATDTLQQAYNNLSLTAVILADKHINLIPIREDANKMLLQDRHRRGLMQLVSFIVSAIYNVNATDEEIVDYLKGGYWSQQQLITFIGVARDCYNKMTVERAAKTSTIKLFENLLQAGSQPLLLATEQRAKAAGTGEHVEAVSQLPSGVYTLKQVIEQAQEKEDNKAAQICLMKQQEVEIQAIQDGASEEEIKALTAKIKPQPLHISELKICQIYNALQVIASQHGTPVVSSEGVELFKHVTSLRSLAKEAFGLTNPNGEELRQTMAALVILDLWRVAIEETRYKNVKTTGGTKRIEKKYRHYVKLVSLPRITTLVNPDGTIAAATDSELELHLHPLLKTGVRQKSAVQNGKEKEYIVAPMTQFIPYEMYENSRKYFRSNDGSGQRFYNMLLAKNNKHEEDMLAEIFDYKGAIMAVRSAAEKRVRKRHQKKLEAQNEGERLAYITELAEKELTLDIMIKKEADAEEKKKRRVISIHKGRNLETIKNWYEQAVELGIIKPHPTRQPAKEREGYVWKWERVKQK